MKLKWVFQNLSSKLPSWASSRISPFRNQFHQNPFVETSSSFVLNHVDPSFLLSVCGRHGHLYLGSSLHASIIKSFELSNHENGVVIMNSLISMYERCGKLPDAVKVFDEMPTRDTVSWNALIGGFMRNGEFYAGFSYFKAMSLVGDCKFDKATLTTILSACDGSEMCCIIEMMHGLTFLSGYEQEITVGNALISSYFKCGCVGFGRQVFYEMEERNVITWTAVISGLAQNGHYEHSLELFREMMSCGSVEPNSLTYLSLLTACSGLEALEEGCQIHGLILKLGIQSDLCIGSALMDMYSKCGSIGDAWKIFESAEELDMVSLTVILAGFTQNGCEEEAIQIFLKMLKMGIEIDENVVSAVLGVFGADTSLRLGQQVHSFIVKKNFSCNPFVSNGLINMYSKCGALDESVKVFDRMQNRNSVTWNSMIAAFARHGDGSKALHLYENMQLEGAKPTDITFLSLLHACSHVGLVNKGMEFLESMTKDHRINPRSEHYACVVDMLGRAGLLSEARTFIEKLPEQPGLLVWQALLGACSLYGDSEMGKYAAEHLFSETPYSSVPYVLLANIYSSEGNWKERARTIRKMKETGMAKETGISWIEIDKKVHSFTVGDKRHPQADIIYGVLMDLFVLMVDEGYVPDKKFILFYLDPDDKKEPIDNDNGRVNDPNLFPSLAPHVHFCFFHQASQGHLLKNRMH
ncbi:pentatricopeptide repeat-containing protein At3g05340 isoform X1 [Cucurbita pepo subsp. pepo]|uniref:pentatricopeptide repeat-containing protein At3g05340 isoform X1 n=1 Tax=Cucurbita pepo subsp. pepo TaxID=3664 RepID=UPI000C9D84D5|nr:pentatricopeptide repeat-containing protein At3g05340 isoform X1 [Cucurbita pepo subsp. pepo]